MLTLVCSGEQKTKEDSAGILLPVFKWVGSGEREGEILHRRGKMETLALQCVLTTCSLVH